MAIVVTSLVMICTAVLSVEADEGLHGHPHQKELNLTVSVSYSWDEGCNASVTSWNLRENTTKKIAVGHCDEGPVYWDYVSPSNQWPLFCDKEHVPCIYVFFRSSVIEDASPPACGFSYDVHNNSKQYCNVMDSREGYHMTSYNFSVEPLLGITIDSIKRL